MFIYALIINLIFHSHITNMQNINLNLKQLFLHELGHL